MSNRKHLMCLAAMTALVAFSGATRAEEARPEEFSQPMTCAQATAFAWFKHQMEIPDVPLETTLPVPAECERLNVANREAPRGDREVSEESK